MAVNGFENDIGHDLGDGCIDTAIVRVYNDAGDMISIEVIPKSDRLAVCVCPSAKTLKLLKRDSGGETIVLTKEQERLILEQLATRAGFKLVPTDGDPSWSEFFDRMAAAGRAGLAREREHRERRAHDCGCAPNY